MAHKTKHWKLEIDGLGTLAFESAALHMGSREAYTLSASNLALASDATGEALSATPVAPEDPSSLVGAEARVVRMLPSGSSATFWRGTVTSFKVMRSGGSVVGNSVSAAGAWHWLERLVYTQEAKFFFAADAEASSRQTSRVVLGQAPDGSPISVAQQIANLAAFAADAAGSTGPFPDVISVDLPSALSAFRLPFDELRDATVAQCLDRVLRFVPGVVVAQRDGSSRRKLEIFGAAAEDAPAAAAYLDEGRVLEREDAASDSAIAGVRVEIEKVGSADGRAVRRMELQLAPEDGTPGPDWMHVTLQLSGRDSSRTKQRLDMITEEFPSDLNDEAWWTWKFGLTTLKNALGVVISEGTRSGAADHPELYPRIAVTGSPEEIEEAGLRSRVEKITCKASYTLNDEAGNLLKIVENQPLEYEVVATSATTREYTWTSAYSATSAEPSPEGLAQALLDQHSQDGRSVAALIRLPIAAEADGYFAGGHAGLPGPGDAYDGLVCQTADYDLASHTVRVVFGPPSHVSPQDLASLMVGGRTRKTCSISPEARTSGEADGDEIDSTVVASGGAKGAGDGTVTRLVVPGPYGGTGHKIDLDPGGIGVADPQVIKAREVNLLQPDGTVRKAQILSGEPYGDPTAPGEPDPPPPPPCGHPGNAGGGGGDEDHPANEDGAGGDVEHPGSEEGEGGITPESGGTCE